MADAATEAEVDALDAADPGPGWTCYATGTDGFGEGTVDEMCMAFVYVSR